MSLSPAAIAELTRRGAERGVDLAPGLDLVERRLRSQIDAGFPFLDEAARWLMDAGGKRFRPMLVLLSGMLGDASPDDPDLVDAGVIVELVHLSTLYHDDVIDAGDVRRGKPAAHVKWSNTVAILTGDFLLARASELSAELGVEVTAIMASTIADLCQGQIREVIGSAEAREHGAVSRIDPDREHYLAVIGEKTASLIASCCRLGALLSGQSREHIDVLTSYGWRLGMAFQLADDVLDIAGHETESGKVPGADLREGVLTLPVLLALEEDGPDSPLGKLVADRERVDEVLEILREHRALDLARDIARVEAGHAKEALAGFAPGPVVDGLVYLADYAAERLT